MCLSDVTNLLSLIFNGLITLFLQCLFSRFEKYFVFFSPCYTICISTLRLCLQFYVLLFVQVLSAFSLILYAFLAVEICPLSYNQFSFAANLQSFLILLAILDMLVFFRFCIHHRLFSKFQFDHLPNQGSANRIILLIFLLDSFNCFFELIYIPFL